MGIIDLFLAPIAWVPVGHEWLVIALILVILFGAKRIPDLARGLGLGVKEFKKAVKNVSEDEEEKPTPKDDASGPNGSSSS